MVPSTAIDLIRRRAFQDAVLLLVIVLGGGWIGARYVATVQPTLGDADAPELREFGAAVALACGHGFRNPPEPPAALSAFLARRVDRFSCDQLNAGVRLGPPNFTQALYRYLMTAVALQWKWSGVSWSGLTPLFGILFAATLCAAYGLFRLAGGPLVGMLGVVPLAMSAHHLGALPHLRDYAKAPFILLLLLVLARLTLPPYSRRRSLLLACAFGLILGVGLGFRNDLLINAPPFVAVVLLLLPVGWRDEWKVKGACLALASVLFVAIAWPILTAYRSGSNTGHVAVLGLMSGFDAPLGLTRPAYDLGSRYLDGQAAVVIEGHSYWRSGRFVPYLSPEYDRVALGLVADVARHWPADLFVRGLASVLRVLDLPFTIGTYDPAVPPDVTASSILHLYKAQTNVLRVLSGLGPLLVWAALVAIGSAAPSGAVALVLLLLYYCGYPAVQFSIRHFFHLEFIGWWALLFLGAAACRVLWRFISFGALPPRPDRRAVVGGLSAAAAAILFTVVPLWVLRTYQQRHVVTLFEACLRAPRAPRALVRTTGSGRTLAAVEGLWSGLGASTGFGVRYLVAEFAAERCDTTDLPVTVAYEARQVESDFSTVHRLAIGRNGPTLLLAPVYYNGEWSHFAGFGLPPAYDACLKSVSLIEDPNAMPVHVEAVLTPQWRSRPLFQRLSDWERDPAAAARDEAHGLVRAQPADLVVPAEPLMTRVAALQADRVVPGVSQAPDGGGWIGRVRVAFPQQVLMHFPSQRIDAGSVLRAAGVLNRGGLRIVVEENGRGFDSLSVHTPGPFTVLIQEPAGGTFGAHITDFSPLDWRMEPRSILREAVWLVAPWARVDDFELHDVAWVKAGR